MEITFDVRYSKERLNSCKMERKGGADPCQVVLKHLVQFTKKEVPDTVFKAGCKGEHIDPCCAWRHLIPPGQLILAQSWDSSQRAQSTVPLVTLLSH